MQLKGVEGEGARGAGFPRKVINLSLVIFESKVLRGHSDDELELERVIKTGESEVGVM